MNKTTVIGVCGLVFVAVLSFPAFADQSPGYRQYFNEGVKAFKEHDDQKALRCFKIARIYDPTDENLKRYLDILNQRGVVLSLPKPQVSPEKSVGFEYYFNSALMAMQQKDNETAIIYFKIAKIFDPSSKQVDLYLNILSPSSNVNVSNEATQAPVQEQVNAPLAQTIPERTTSPVGAASSPSPSVLPSVQPQQSVIMPPQAALYVPAPKAKGPPEVLMLAQITNNGQNKPKMQIELNSSVIIEGRNIQRFLIVNEGFIGVKIINADQIAVDAQKIGSTFLHIWDDFGRHTLYVEVVFPTIVNTNILAPSNGVEHSQPFVFTYSNDWDTYYSGKDIPDLKRSSYEFNQSLGVKGETPYGIFDASGSYLDFNSFSEFDSYTVGLSQIPLEGTSDLDLRGLDALRYLSPLTMTGTLLRGAFADVDLLDDNLGLSVSHGQEAQQEFQNFTNVGQSQFYNAYIDALKLTLFPKSESDRYSFNFATAYGPQRQGYLSDHVYSVEGQHKFNDFLTLNAEQGSDSSHDASLASLKWQDGSFRSGLNFRNIDKNYTTISGLPSNQGETGATWTTDAVLKNITANSFLETYRDRLDFNPDDPSALNYDGNGHLRVDIAQDLWSDTDMNYVDTPGELSPERSFQTNERLSRNIGVWNSQKATVFGGVGYQNSHSSDSDISDYDRKDLLAGVQLPLTNQVSSFANYEYDWLDQPDSGGNSNPSVINAGLAYSKQITPKFSVNSQLSYRNELGVKANSNSFLSGEESIIITSGFAYNITPDMSIFADGDVSKILSHIGNQGYDDFEVHLGMRITFGGASYWDPLGTVSGIVFKDRNGDGKFEPGDAGIPNVKLKVGDKEVTTDKNGRYSVLIRAKGVEVVPVLDTVPGGLIFSTPQSLDVKVVQGRKSRADFGLISQTGIYGIVFVDKNGTGLPNDTDKFVGKVRVILDGKIIQKSDAHGAFYFRQVSPGEHIISIDINTLALDMVPLIKLKNKIDVAEGTNYMFNIPVQVKQAEGGQDS